MPTHITESRRILAISPHLDDVSLSVGGIVARAADNGANVVVGTLFTAETPDPPPTSPIIQELEAFWKLGSSPYAFRRAEDVAAVGVLGARLTHGDLLDAIYRRDREGNCLYPTRAAVFSQPSQDDEIASALNQTLTRWIEEIQPDSILCPLAVGRHVDHTVTSEAVRNIALKQHLNVFLYEDFPYSTGRFPPGSPDTVQAGLARTKWKFTQSEAVSVDMSVKLRSILKYESQIADLFATTQELEAALKEYMASADEADIFFETIWPVSA